MLELKTPTGNTLSQLDGNYDNMNLCCYMFHHKNLIFTGGKKKSE